jgi:hypothetical protein
VLPTVFATRYVSPLREGGSLPGLVEADDLGTYVVKFRGAGQGVKVLVAEVVVTEIARHLGIAVPEIKAIELDAAIARYEADQEVQDLLTASLGLNLAIDFLPGSLGYDGVSFAVDADEAAAILWADAFTANIDRTWKNPNLLIWHKRLWCIDHGAALYFHYGWPRSVDAARFARQPYDVGAHIFGAHVDRLAAADARLRPQLDEGVLIGVLDAVPDSWLETESDSETETATGVDVAAIRRRYVDHLLARLASREWLAAT